MLPEIIYILREAGRPVVLNEICLKLDEMGAGNWRSSKDDCTRSAAIINAIDQGIDFGFIVADKHLRTYKLGVNYLRYENYSFNSKLQEMSDNIARFGLGKTLSFTSEQLSQSDISDESSEYSDDAAYDTDDERSPTPKKKMMKLEATTRKGSRAKKTRNSFIRLPPRKTPNKQ